MPFFLCELRVSRHSGSIAPLQFSIDLAMELRHLRYFLAVAEHQGFRKAAQALRVSHPSLCEQIIDLEREIGARLFERTHHEVCLRSRAYFFSGCAQDTQMRVRSCPNDAASLHGLQRRVADRKCRTHVPFPLGSLDLRVPRTVPNGRSFDPAAE